MHAINFCLLVATNTSVYPMFTTQDIIICSQLIDFLIEYQTDIWGLLNCICMK